MSTKRCKEKNRGALWSLLRRKRKGHLDRSGHQPEDRKGLDEGCTLVAVWLIAPASFCFSGAQLLRLLLVLIFFESEGIVGTG